MSYSLWRYTGSWTCTNNYTVVGWRRSPWWCGDVHRGGVETFTVVVWRRS
ncbi:hypothetical protein LSAT2_026162, partial [Lamellibrachia satsuma]